MTFEERINEDLKNAMKAQDKKAMEGIRAIKAAIILARTDGSGLALDEVREVQMLQKLVKTRRESLDIYQKNGREDLAAVERDEIEVISRYLPKMLEGPELEAILKGIIADVGATSQKDMGKVMGLASKTLAGKADGKNISETVKRLLGA